jgi:transposase
MTPPPDFTALSASEKDALLVELWAALEALRAENAALTARVAELNKPTKTPDNSSLPPSRGQKANKPDDGGKQRTKASHPGVGRPLAEKPDRIVEARADACPHCSAGLAADDQALQQVYDRIEIPPIKPVVTQVRRHGGVCPCCRKAFLAPVPEGLEPGSPYGSSVVSLGIGLRYGHAIGYERLSGLFDEVFGLSISEGALGNLFNRARPAFAEQVTAIKTKLLAGPVICSDETTARIRARNWWQWVFQNDQACVHIIRDSRGKDVPAEFLGDVRPAFWVSDRLGAQRDWGKEWQVCLAHQLRDVQYAIDAGDQIFAPSFKRILLRASAIGRRRPDLKDSTLRQYRADLDRRLDAALKLDPATKDGRRVHRQCKKFRAHFFTFVTNREVPPTNNGSEQALRPSVIFRKVTNCFRSDWGMEFFADVRSVIDTGRRLGLSAIEAIRKTLAGEPFFASG